MLLALPHAPSARTAPGSLLAVGQYDTSLFANGASAEMLGYIHGNPAAVKFQQIFHTLPADESAVSVVQAHADVLIQLLHVDGSNVRGQDEQVGTAARR